MIEDMLKENRRRLDAKHAHFCPITGRGSIGDRTHVCITGLDPEEMWLPTPMMAEPLVAELAKAGSVGAYCLRHNGWTADDVAQHFDRLRCRHDFAYWCARYVYIKPKGGGEECVLRLTYPQRAFVSRIEDMRLAGLPIRIVLLKARQWGGSTASQLYMAWLQLVHCRGLNSLIIAHQSAISEEIKDMFDVVVKHYPLRLLYDVGTEYKEGARKTERVGKSGSTFRVPQRNAKVKIGTAERPNGCRGGDYNLVHLSEVGIWKTTQGKKPEDIVRSACSGVVYKPNTMIVYESTANGVGNFFHKEYIDARDNPKSQFQAVFISWYQLEYTEMEMHDDERQALAQWLYDNRDNPHAPTVREESGQYLWWLWQRGATLEGIKWYMTERTKYMSHGEIAAEFPSDDTEAFVNSGAAVFDRYKVEALRSGCRKPRYIGEVEASTEPLCGLHFTEDSQGALCIWSMPDGARKSDGSWHVSDEPTADTVADRYLTVVDVGGRSNKADWSVVTVIDRLMMIDGGRPQVVAQWRGHCDIDILAWRAARIAAFYENALLVIESNTLETHDRERMVEGDQSGFILNQIRQAYPNLYARRQPEEDIRRGLPRKYGFHTNVSTKPMIISTLIKMVREHLYVERDEMCLNEYLAYERKPNGSYGAIPGEHDDILMTRAIGLHICMHEMRLPHIAQKFAPIPRKRPAHGAASI